jgi:DNA repair ATPase RecN
MPFDVLRDDINSADALLAVIANPKAATDALAALRQARADADVAAEALDKKQREVATAQRTLAAAETAAGRAADAFAKEQEKHAVSLREYQGLKAKFEADRAQLAEDAKAVAARESDIGRREARVAAAEGAVGKREAKLAADEAAVAAKRERLERALRE